MSKRALVVTCYPDLATATVPDIRNVYLVRLSATCGVEECELYDLDIPLHRALEIVVWAVALGIEVREDPAGNLFPGFQWPDGAKGFTLPRPALPPPDPELFGGI